MTERIASWLTYQPRTHLVLVNRKPQEFEFVDFGYEFAKAIESDVKMAEKKPQIKRMLPTIATDAAKKILRKHTRTDASIGDYVAIENWAILEEPELSPDLDHFFSNVSRNTTVILLIEGEIKDNRYHSLDLGNLQYYIPE